MKETVSPIIDNVQEVRQVKAEKKQQIIGMIRPGDNHKIWQYNRVLFQLELAKFENVPFEIKKDNKPLTTRKKVITKEYCYYFSSLNEKNARRKIQKQFNPEFIIVLD